MKGDIQSNEYKVGGWRAHYILIICSLLYMVNYMDRQVLSAVLEPMKQDLGLSDTQAGSLMTVFLLSIALFSLPLAYMVDRWSRRKAIALMAIFWSAFTFITGLGKSFLGVLIPRSLVGVGEAGFSSGGTAMLAAVYPPESRGRVMGVFNLVIPLGASLGVILGGYLSKNHGGWGPIMVGGISDALGGGAEGLKSAFKFIALAGFVAAFLLWLGSRHYPGDMDKVKGAVLQAEK